MPNNIIIYPTGTTSNTNPHIVFKGDTGQVQLNVVATPSGAALVVSSSTQSSGTVINPTSGITTTGLTMSTGSLRIKGNLAINSDGTWGGNLQNIKGAQGAQGSQGTIGTQGAQGSQGFKGKTGAQGSQGGQGSQGFQGNQGNKGAQGSQGGQGSTGFRYGWPSRTG